MARPRGTPRGYGTGPGVRPWRASPVDASRGIEGTAEAVIAVPEVRDYDAINAEIVRHLDAGFRTIRLSGVRGHRLLASSLVGPWSGVVMVDGDAGPELASGLDAPGLIVVGRGRAGDGAASGLKAGQVVVLGQVGMAFGYAMSGGLAVASGDAEGRAGLCQSGGDLILLRQSGPLAGERQTGGRLYLFAETVGPHAGRGRRGGRFVAIAPEEKAHDTGEEADRLEWAGLLAPLGIWLGPSSQRDE